MGLDGVELLLEVEETFGFSIPDQDVAELHTPGQLHQYILDHRFNGRATGCLSSVVFYRLRRALMSVAGLDRDAIRPAVKMKQVFPRQHRRHWAQLRKALGLRLPPLARPTWVSAIATTLGCAGVATVPPMVGLSYGTGAATVAGLLSVIGIPWLLITLTEPLAVCFRSNFATVGGLTTAILQRNYGAISDACQKANAEEVWQTLQALIVEQLGVRREDVTKEADFVKDLGLS